jgi:hypothetical protein
MIRATEEMGLPPPVLAGPCWPEPGGPGGDPERDGFGLSRWAVQESTSSKMLSSRAPYASSLSSGCSIISGRRFTTACQSPKCDNSTRSRGTLHVSRTCPGASRQSSTRSCRRIRAAGRALRTGNAGTGQSSPTPPTSVRRDSLQEAKARARVSAGRWRLVYPRRKHVRSSGSGKG